MNFDTTQVRASERRTLAGRFAVVTRFAWVPLPVLVLAMAAFWAADSATSYESALALLALNFFFSTVISLVIAVLAARTFLARGQPAVLMLGCAMTIWGASSLVAAIGEHVGNYNITIHNLGVCFSALSHLTGVLLLSRSRPSVRSTGEWLAFGYTGSLAGVGLIWMATLESWLPTFFIQGQGGTPLRTLVLMTAVTAFALAALALWLRQRRSPSEFFRWYALGLAMLSAGGAGLVLQHVHGGFLGWTSRATQYAGGLYMMIGAIAAVRESGAWELPLAAALEEARDQYELLFQSINDGVVLHPVAASGASGSLLRANDVLCRLLGYSHAEIHRLTPRDLFGADLPELPTGTRAYERWLVARNGRRIATEISTRVFSHRGEVMQLSIIRDVTERMRATQSLRESEERLRLAQEVTQVGTFEWNIQTGAHRWTAELERMHGLAPETFPGTREAWERLVHPDDRKEAVRRFADAIETGRFTHEWRVVWSDGTTRWLAGRAVVFTDDAGKPLRLLGVNIDITDRKAAETERDELLRIAESARAEAEASSLAKDVFVATVSHELRTPLSPIIAWTTMLQGPMSSDGEQLRRGLATIERCARAEARIVDDLLDVSRITSGQLRIERQETPLGPVIHAAVDVIRPAADAKSIRLEAALEPDGSFVVGDPARLQQIVWNLLSNAVKFTPQGGHVRVGVDLTDRHVTIQVRDTGQGISAEFLPYVFDRFRQADGSVTRAHAGLGLGLAIVRHLVEAHGGSIRVESAGLGYGSVFTITLPRPPSHTANEHAPLAQSAEASGAGRALIAARILVVDDDPNSNEVVAALLESCGADVQVADSVAAALDVLSRRNVEILVTDVGMPGADGYALLAAMRASPHGPANIPAVALTAYASADDRAGLLDAGFQAHIAKPFQPDDLVAAIARLRRR
jgi:PAS domain S-box-containing protein